MNLEDIMLTKIIQKQNDKRVISYMWNLNKPNSEKQRAQ